MQLAHLECTGPHSLGTEFLRHVVEESIWIWYAHAKARATLLKARLGPGSTTAWALQELCLHQQAEMEGVQRELLEEARLPEAYSPGLPNSPFPCRGLHTYARRAHNTHSPACLPLAVGRHPGLLPFGNSAFGTAAHTHPNTPARSGGAQPKPEPTHTHPHRTPQPGVAGYRGSAHMSTHTPQHPSQEWWGAAETRTQTHTPTPQAPARSGGVRGKHAHQNAHPNTPATSGGAQPKPEPKHTHPHRTTQPGVAGCKRSAKTSTHTPQLPSQGWRGAAETRAQTQPRPKHHTTVGNPVSIARALRQPVPCR